MKTDKKKEVEGERGTAKIPLKRLVMLGMIFKGLDRSAFVAGIVLFIATAILSTVYQNNTDHSLITEIRTLAVSISFMCAGIGLRVFST